MVKCVYFNLCFLHALMNLLFINVGESTKIQNPFFKVINFFHA